MQGPSPARGAPTLPRALVRLMLAMEDAYGDASRELGLSSQQAELLCLARQAAPIGDLASAMRCDRSNVSRMVDRLSGRGLVARHPDARDGRMSLVRLTNQGERTMRRFVELLGRRVDARLESWPQRRRATAVTLLNELADALGAGEAASLDRGGARAPAAEALRGL